MRYIVQWAEWDKWTYDFETPSLVDACDYAKDEAMSSGVPHRVINENSEVIYET